MKNKTVKYRWNVYKIQPSTEFTFQNKCKSKCINSQNCSKSNYQTLNFSKYPSVQSPKVRS